MKNEVFYACSIYSCINEQYSNKFKKKKNSTIPSSLNFKTNKNPSKGKKCKNFIIHNLYLYNFSYGQY